MLILAIPYTHTLSHVSRTLLAAEELKRRGHEVIFGGEGPLTGLLRERGFKVLPLHEPDPEVLFGNIRKGNLRFVSRSELEAMIEADLGLFRQTSPDLVLTDGRFSAPISTHAAGLKHAAIVNASSTEYRALPYVPFLSPGFLEGGSFAAKLLRKANLKIEMAVFDRVMSDFKDLGRKYGVSRPVTATNCLAGKDLTLLADVPEYFPTAGLPPDYHYIGPLTMRSKSPPPSWWPPRKDGRPLVYVTMGTTGIGDFFSKAHNLLKRSPLSAVITTGGQAEGLETVQGKIYVEPFIDGDLVMEECDIVVCHGGNGTIYQALGHGKPIIGIPAIPDQRFNMRRVESLGLGKSLVWKGFAARPVCLIKAIEEVLGNGDYSRNAIAFRSILSGYDAPRAAADLIERLRNL